MRRTTVALIAIFLAPTAVMAMTAGQMAPGGGAGIGHGSFLGGNLIIAKGDKSGTGPGNGGHKGQHKAERKGKQKHEKG